MSLKEKKKEGFIQKQINFTPDQVKRGEKYVKIQQYAISNYSFNQLVRESLDFWLDYWNTEEGLDTIWKYVERRMKTEDYQNFLEKVLFKLLEAIYFDPKFKEKKPEFAMIDTLMSQFKIILNSMTMEEEE